MPHINLKMCLNVHLPKMGLRSKNCHGKRDAKRGKDCEEGSVTSDMETIHQACSHLARPLLYPSRCKCKFKESRTTICLPRCKFKESSPLFVCL